MTSTEKKQIDKLDDKFTKLHRQLLELKQYEIASELSKVFYETQSLNYTDGINFVKKIYNL